MTNKERRRRLERDADTVTKSYGYDGVICPLTMRSFGGVGIPTIVEAENKFGKLMTLEEYDQFCKWFVYNVEKVVDYELGALDIWESLRDMDDEIVNEDEEDAVIARLNAERMAYSEVLFQE